MQILTKICQPIEASSFYECSTKLFKGLKTLYSEKVGATKWYKFIVLSFLTLPLSAFKCQPGLVPQCPCSAAVHEEVGLDFNDASVVWNGFIHPLHVSQTAILHWEAEDFWVCIGVERP